MPTPWDKDIAAVSVPQLMKPENLLRLVKTDEERRGVDMDIAIVIDPRGADYKGGTISSALHIPAEDFDNCLLTVFKTIAASGISIVCFCDS
jgi:hypothetical protein